MTDLFDMVVDAAAIAAFIVTIFVVAGVFTGAL
jgi:hypothetical protein